MKNAGGNIGTDLLTKVEDMGGLISPVRDAVLTSTSSGGLKRDVSSPAVLRSMSASPAVPEQMAIAHAQYFVHVIAMGRMMVIIVMRNTVRMWKSTTTTTSNLAAVRVLEFSAGNLMTEATKTNIPVAMTKSASVSVFTRENQAHFISNATSRSTRSDLKNHTGRLGVEGLIRYLFIMTPRSKLVGEVFSAVLILRHPNMFMLRRDHQVVEALDGLRGHYEDIRQSQS
ncbi:MAG: hypothetical protein Q9180_002348 [Flavoplaca navasiana]